MHRVAEFTTCYCERFTKESEEICNVSDFKLAPFLIFQSANLQSYKGEVASSVARVRGR